MISNNRSARLVGLFILIAIGLGGCSSMPSFTSEQGTGGQGTGEQGVSENANVDENAGNADGIPAPAELSPEELEAQALAMQARNLMASINAFKLDKSTQKRLNASQLSNVSSAISQLANAQYDAALRDVQAVIDDPNFTTSPNTAVWVLRGDIYRANQDIENAIADYQSALTVVSSNYQAHNRLGVIYRDAGQFDLAKTHYTDAIEAWPGNAASYRNRGILFDLYVGDKVAALNDYQVYKALLDFQIETVQSPPKSLVKEQKLVRQWILDIKRQIAALEREQANG